VTKESDPRHMSMGHCMSLGHLLLDGVLHLTGSHQTVNV